MKRKMSTLVLILFLLAIGNMVAEAAGITEGRKDRPRIEERREAAQDRVENAKEMFSELQPKIAQAKANRDEIARLKSEAAAVETAAGNRVKELKASSASLTEEQLALLQSALNSMRQNRSALNGSIGEIEAEAQSLRSAYQARNLGQAHNALDNILSIQQKRINLVRQSIADMNVIINI